VLLGVTAEHRERALLVKAEPFHQDSLGHPHQVPGVDGAAQV
jgi:hypothetical protein